MKNNSFDLRNIYYKACEDCNGFNLALNSSPVAEPLSIEELDKNITFDFEVYQTFNENVYFYIIAHNWNDNTARRIAYLYTKDNNGRVKADHLRPICTFIAELQKCITY